MKLSILYGCDDHYAPYTGISLTSLLENNRDIDDLTIYLAAMNIRNENLQKFQEITALYGRKLIVLDTEKAQAEMYSYNCNGWNGSLATWLRFFVLDQIPTDENRLLWLDSDTLVQKSLRNIATLPMGDCPIAAVCDSLSYFFRFKLGLGYADPYFNAGVILFNLPIWRESNLLDGMMDHLKHNISRYALNDQDLLNDYFRGRILKLSPEYNAQGFLAAYSLSDYYKVFPWIESAYYSQQDIAHAIQEPTVVHFFRFLGDYPWTAGKNYHPYKTLYKSWHDRSLWKDSPQTAARTDFSFCIEKVLYRILPRKVFLTIFRTCINREMPKKPL